MKYPKDQGYQEFEFRPGVKFPKFKGMHRMGDPASIPVNQFHYLENVRIVGGEIDSRGGQGRYIDHSESGCMEGIFPPEFQFADDEAGSIVLNGFSTGVLNITTLTANTHIGKLSLYFVSIQFDPTSQFQSIRCQNFDSPTISIHFILFTS